MRRQASIVVVGTLLLAMLASLGNAMRVADSTDAPAIAPTDASPRLPFSATERFFDPNLRNARGSVNVVVAMDATAPLGEVVGSMKVARAVPPIGDVRLIAGSIDASLIDELEGMPSVLAVLEDKAIPFSGPDKPAPNPNSRLPAALREGRMPEFAPYDREALFGGPEVTMYEVVNFTGARRAWTDLGVDGSGVTIAVVDTGVDHGTFNLGDGATARMSNGLPSSFDPDGSNFAWTLEEVTPYVFGPSTFVTTSGTDPLIYIFDLFGAFGPYGPTAVLFSDLFGFPFPADMEITGIRPSLSDTYRFGCLFQWNFFLDIYPVLVVDANTAGVYDTVYIDLSFDWWLNGFDPSISPDYSFSDEPALEPWGGNVVASRDMDGDGYPDISAGSLSHALDVWGLDPDPAERFGILKPVDDGGDYITMVYDWNGHGTGVSSSAAGRDVGHPVAGPGTGPGARIMGIPIFAWFDIIEGWLWAAGFDLVTNTTDARFVATYGTVLGDWVYTGAHKADIISNSWGSSDWVTFPYALSWPWYDVLTTLEDALMVPGYSDPTYPGTLMVHAGGNGGSGYGTMTNPGFNTLAMTVGASTSLNYTSLGFGGFHNDVISWSARGPNALGNVKPDLLQVGAYAWAAAPVWLGFGSGIDAYWLFSGTSQATPVTSGSAAVAIEAYTNAWGSKPSPFVTKAILKSSAVDLGYDPFVQGAGHVDVYNAAVLALGQSGIMITSDASWDNLAAMIDPAWAASSMFYGQQIQLAKPAAPIVDTGWYAGALTAGQSTAAEFTIAAPAGTVSGTIEAVWHNRIVGADLLVDGVTGFLGPGWLEGLGGRVTFPSSAIPANADLMVVRGIQPYSYLDPDGNYIWDNRSRIIVGDWVDANGNTSVEPNEVRVFNYGFNTGTTSEARVGLPAGRFQGDLLLWFSHALNAGELFRPMPFSIQVEFYERAPWSWISTPPSFIASPGSPAVWTATMQVPPSADPGVYEGQILVTPTGGNTSAVPVSVIVPQVIDAATLSEPTTTAPTNLIYDPSIVAGYFDWRWRYEAGDWKLWFVDIQDPTTVALRADVSWTGTNTDVDLWTFTPSMVPGDSTFSQSLGSGRFRWGTRTGGTSDWIAMTTGADCRRVTTGLYTFALHNVLLEGGTLGGPGPTPEVLVGSVSVAKLNPRCESVWAQPGTVVSVPFTLSTGFDLADVTFVTVPPPSSSFPSTGEPFYSPVLSSGESVTLWANITIPADAQEGRYQNLYLLFSDEIDLTVEVEINVDSSGPGVAILAPADNAWLRASTTLVAAVSDPGGIVSVTFNAGLQSGSMTQDPVTGQWTAPWNTASSPDGTHSVSVTATDVAGNVDVEMVTVFVDNTLPAASFSAPGPNAWVRGTLSVSFSATDANLAGATLSYGTTTVDVTGLTSQNVDTTLLGDGALQLTLTAVDIVGNSRSATLSVNVDNTAPVVAIGAPVANAFVRGTISASFQSSDANLDMATIALGTLPAVDVTGLTSRSLDTTAVADGVQSVTLVATDLAGNQATASVSVTVDNTAPVVSISSPANAAAVRGTQTITWSADDTNLDTVWLVIDGQAQVVTGTSFTWDSNSVGDGAHSIEIRANDLAGNEGSTSVSVTTDNVAVAATNAQNTGFSSGLFMGIIMAVVAAVIGLLIGFFLGRRRKPADATMAAPAAPLPMEPPRPSDSTRAEEEL